MAVRIKWNPESAGYDYRSARAAGIKADKTGHWPSRVPRGPQEGLILKGRKHKTWHKTVEGEKEAGYKIIKKGVRYYSTKIKELSE